jgi:DNA-binding Lrp family transcriptional regulator
MIDALDKAILNELGMNCRTSYQSLAEKHGVSATAIKKRVEKLIESGVLAEFIVELNLAMIDGEFFLALIDTDASVREEEFIELLGTNEMISEVGALAGGSYIAVGSYIGATGLSKIGHFLRKLDSVKEVEIHTLLFIRGKKYRLKRLHLRVLRQLIEDPRMAVTKIAKKTGLAARTVSRAIDEILESESVRLSIRWNLNASESITFLSKIRWDDDKTDLEKMMALLRKEFPTEFWEPLISATEPVMFPAFVVDTLRDVERVTKTLEQQDFIKSVVTLIGKPSRSFHDLRRYHLEDMLKSSTSS